jgi:hypothetical protein
MFGCSSLRELVCISSKDIASTKVLAGWHKIILLDEKWSGVLLLEITNRN